MKDNKLGRRRALKVLGIGGVTAFGLFSAACGGGEEGGGGGGGGGGDSEGCGAPVDAQSQQMRTTLQYKEQSTEAGKNCANCAQYVEGQYGDCGGCNLFSGPVQPQGHCLSWAAQAEG
ncbi:MAG TPA: high-potential iron-sulfur protein [Polyangiaceae bacterium LLY-WYZ-15_(1-7)]|nr:hypothetical protein [Myxococcales bacterium]MAT24502.1 hypothetical protein [Sandaracinus sp.]HJL04147.1 high-potential iron-sulfur protein [Polyangiaceae bacterium LLY-WYZ-15_(1-7)]MBJ73748.1 hypothetical protein [Sandaracinus sp.]HJL09663.1 high-potential iron-sulfur protein [Polyangiaceae bacterium LLY-WYZ-15_(1-7)]